MPTLIRSWNVFHGNTVPPTSRGYLREMIELATEGRPAVICLQEVPVWALPHLAGWSGMEAYCSVARGPRRPAALAAAITRLRNGLFRSRLAGQANAILVDRSLDSADLGGVQISDKGRERRIVHAVRIDEIGIIGNLHASNAAPAVVLPELERARAFIDALAEPGEARILAGDFNVAQPAPVGYEPGGPGIDHILVADVVAEAPFVWPRERRIVAGRVLSDHAPVERLVGR